VAPWWSAYTEAHAQRDFAWIRSSHRWSWWITAGLFVPGTLAAAFLTPLLIELWIGTHAMQPDALLVWLMAAWQTLQLLGQPPALLLNGLGQVRGAAIASMAGHLLSLVAMGWLGLRHGATGVVAGMMLGYAIVGLPGVLLTAGGQLRKLGRE
jgi:O-antigen/teichoic acid export membrane protein